VPPRYAYWTIIAGGLPTAFRAADRDDLLPTFQRIKEKHPDAEMKWFARGKLWESPEAARTQRDHTSRNRSGGERDRRSRDRTNRDGDRAFRDKNWRPGGEHRDPRQKFIDAKKDRNARMRTERWERKNAPDRDGFKSQEPGLRREQRPRDQKKTWGHKKAWDTKKPWQRDEKKPWQRDEKKPWQRERPRAQGAEEPRQPKRPLGPNREPKPGENPEPSRPPHPNEPNIPSPGPPEQGRGRRRPFRSQNRFNRGPRRG